MKKLSINLPTNRPEYFFNIFLPGLKNIQGMLNQTNVEIVFIFQRPWTWDEVKKAETDVLNLGFQVQKRYANSKNISMMKIRQEGLNTEFDYSLLVDDDMQFGSGTKAYPQTAGERYLHALEYMESFPKCGFIVCEGTLGGSVQKLEISSTKAALFSIPKGMLIRNIKESGPVYKNSIHLLGGLEDQIIGFHYLENGYFPAKQFNVHVIHKHRKKVGFDDQSVIHNKAIIEANAVQYIRDRYDDQTWVFGRTTVRIPKKLKQLFIQGGGNPMVFKDRIYRMDFADAKN